MKKIFLLVLLFSLSALAQKSVSAKPKKRSMMLETYYQIGFTGHVFQEDIRTERSGVSENIESQSQGLGISLRYINPSSSPRWIQSHSLEINAGFLRLQGITATLNDELKNQPWYSITLSPGYSYRTTPVSEIGLSLPLAYRIIGWKTEDPTYKLSRGNSFSYGIAGTFTNHFSLKNSLLVALTHQVAWDSTVWSAGWIHSFR